MAFEIRWDEKAVEKLRKLEKHISSRIIKKIDNIKDNPFLYAHPIKQIKCFKIRVGDYRILLDINWEKRIIEILLIDHRKKIYKEMKDALQFFVKKT